MDKEKLWSIYVKSNPSFAGDGNVTMSARGLRKLFDTTWEQAKKETIDRFIIPKRTANDLFEGIFNGRS